MRVKEKYWKNQVDKICVINNFCLLLPLNQEMQYGLFKKIENGSSAARIQYGWFGGAFERSVESSKYSQI